MLIARSAVRGSNQQHLTLIRQVHVHTKAEERDLKRELQLASTADHPNIVRHLCSYYCEDAYGDRYVWIAMEMMSLGALNVVLERGWRLWVRDAPAPVRPLCSPCVMHKCGSRRLRARVRR